MKSLVSLLLYFVGRRASRRNVLVLIRFFLVLAGLITLYSVLFHILMGWEGQDFSWITGFYWTLTVMSTLGFGDITFHTDLGRIFSILVLLTGMVFMLTLLPFTFIQFFYAPWMEAQSASRVRRALPETTEGHVILIHDDEVSRALIRKLGKYQYPYVMVTGRMQEALAYHDEGIYAMVGDLDEPDTYVRARIDHAALLAATSTDVVNTAVVSAVRGLTESLQILATAVDEDSVDILQLAGADQVLQLGEILGEALSRRLNAGDATTHVVGTFDRLLIAEATAANSPLVGKTLRECHLRELVSVNVIGLWERGVFKPADPDAVITPNTVLVLAGSRSQLDEYDDLLGKSNKTKAPVVILGGGRVGRATGRELKKRDVDYRIVEKLEERILDDEHYVHGSAADIEILKQAGIMECPAAVITTHDDELNVYLTIYCRKLRPDIQIITRATREGIVGTLHRAGADFVMSYASMGSNTIFNLLKRSGVVMVAEGLNLFRMDLPASLAGRSIAESGVRKDTGCTIVAYQQNGEVSINPDPFESLPEGCEIVVIGSVESEEAFLECYSRA